MEETNHVRKGDEHPVPSGNESGGNQCRSGFGTDFEAAAGFCRPSGADGPNAGEGLIVSLWETEADANASEATPRLLGR